MSSEKLKTQAKEARTTLQKCLDGEEVSEEEIRHTQRFFNRVGTYFLREAFIEAREILSPDF